MMFFKQALYEWWSFFHKVISHSLDFWISSELYGAMGYANQELYRESQAVSHCFCYIVQLNSTLDFSQNSTISLQLGKPSCRKYWLYYIF